jgi:hypothetical protein
MPSALRKRRRLMFADLLAIAGSVLFMGACALYARAAERM